MKLPTLLITCFGIICQSAATAAKPSIIVILCDDVGYTDIGCYGGEIYTNALTDHSNPLFPACGLATHTFNGLQSKENF